ncbi:BTB/POZ domain-containing protein 6-like isoform X1 [Haliotis rufescens]|uniref:BTB/POZ domain-containing protein 6-like isoform X1 n=1 Tax=Haliotis rufescens TaxID=6454 RepID=UPI00201F963D|nr:BTB/POZ domain-containing protein 6-like isoform X1 [Haliotis rufescens]
MKLAHCRLTIKTMSSEHEESGYVDNWQSGKSVTECNLRMLDTEDFSDVTFRVGSEKQVVRAHRYVLVSRSCVFHAMFCGPLAEKGEVTIPDIEADIFREFLRYVYTDKATINTDTVMGLMYTSRKYSVDALFGLCVTFLETSLSEDNVCQILEECHGYGELELEQKALKILTEGGEGVIQSPGFVGLCSDCLEKCLKSDTMKAKEEDLFEAVFTWIKARCQKEGVSDTPENKRRLLGEMRYEIRFTSMPLEFLVNVVGPSAVLTDSERVRIIDRKVNSAVDISPFNQSQRRISDIADRDVSKTYRYVNRFLNVSYFRSSTPGRYSISFSSSQSIVLEGCQLYGGPFGKVHMLNIRVYDSNDVVISEPLLNTRVKLESCFQGNDVLFHRWVSLTAGVTYTLCVDMDGGPTAWGEVGQDTVTVDGVQFSFKDSPMCTMGTSTKGGQIPGLIFNLA